MNECQTCKYWLDAANGEGECHRYAPKPVHFIPSQDWKVQWPATFYNEGCGEHRDMINP